MVRDMKKYQISIPEADMVKLKVIAAQRQTTIKALIWEALTAHFPEIGKPETSDRVVVPLGVFPLKEDGSVDVFGTCEKPAQADADAFQPLCQCPPEE